MEPLLPPFESGGGGKRKRKKRRSAMDLSENERWNCPFGCGKFYRNTSTKSIHSHLQECPRRTSSTKTNSGGFRSGSANAEKRRQKIQSQRMLLQQNDACRREAKVIKARIHESLSKRQKKTLTPRKTKPPPKSLGSGRKVTSKYIGVSYHANRRKWQVKIRSNGKQKHLGYFEDEHDAARAYNRAARAVHSNPKINQVPESPGCNDPTTKKNMSLDARIQDITRQTQKDKQAIQQKGSLRARDPAYASMRKKVQEDASMRYASYMGVKKEDSSIRTYNSPLRRPKVPRSPNKSPSIQEKLKRCQKFKKALHIGNGMKSSRKSPRIHKPTKALDTPTLLVDTPTLLDQASAATSLTSVKVPVSASTSGANTPSLVRKSLLDDGPNAVPSPGAPSPSNIQIPSIPSVSNTLRPPGKRSSIRQRRSAALSGGFASLKVDIGAKNVRKKELRHDAMLKLTPVGPTGINVGKANGTYVESPALGMNGTPRIADGPGELFPAISPAFNTYCT